MYDLDNYQLEPMFMTASYSLLPYSTYSYGNVILEIVLYLNFQ